MASLPVTMGGQSCVVGFAFVEWSARGIFCTLGWSYALFYMPLEKARPFDYSQRV